MPELDSIGRDNAPDACITRIAKIDFRETANDTKGAHWDNGGKFAIDVFDRTENWEYENQLVKFAPPHHIDWRGNTKVGRSDDGATVWVSADRNEGAYSPTLAFKPGDAETADRIEYAMKFLQASCDAAANTGF